MNARDLPELERRLTELAEALGGRAITKAALKVWLDALAECEARDVWDVLTDWPKSHAKPPIPAEVLKAARENATARRERQAAADRQAAEVHNPLDPARYKPANGPSAAYALFCQSVAEIKRRPRPGPKDWAYKLKEREEAGEVLGPVQKQNWRAALAYSGPVEVEETEDEREARLEREAIQAEEI